METKPENLANGGENVTGSESAPGMQESVAERVLREVAERRAQETVEAKPAVETPEQTTAPTGVEASAEQTEAPEKQEVSKVEQDTPVKAEVVEPPVVSTDKSSEADEVSAIADAEIHEDLAQEDSDEVDYSELSKQELVDTLKEILTNKSVQDIKDHIDQIKVVFYKAHHADIAELKRKYLEAGNEEDEFKPEPDKLELELKELIKEYKTKKAEHTHMLEQEKEDNLKAKNDVIEAIKALSQGTESLDQTFNDFRNLQDKWKSIGQVPQNDVKTIWENYHHAVEGFYDFIRINKELRDLDLKKNLEAKIKFCESAEGLLLEESPVTAFRALQKLHNQWREVGPVPRENKDDIWVRFSEATKKINQNYQKHFEEIKVNQDNNLKAKTLLCERAEELGSDDVKNNKDWDEKSKEIIELQKLWKLIGFAPKKHNNTIYERFRTACDKFFERKRMHFSEVKEEYGNNLQLKKELCIQAEGMKDSDDWKKTTQEYIDLQKRWKEIGPVSRKHSDAIWKRFRSACNYFFDKKKEHFSSLDKQQDDNLKLKEELIAKIEGFVFTDDMEADLESLKGFQKEWTEIGHVPFAKKDDVQRKFREAINGKFDNLRIDRSKRNEIKFKNKIETIRNSPKSGSKLRMEQDKLQKKLEKIESDIIVWENNIGFFSRSKGSQSLVADFEQKINSAKDAAKELKQKIDMMSRMGDDEVSE